MRNYRHAIIRFCAEFANWASCYRYAFLVLATAIPAAVIAQNSDRSFTLKQALSAPFNSNLTAGPTKGRFAWVSNQEGKRNLWVAEPSGDGKNYRAHALTQFNQDDGQQIGQLTWSRDGDKIGYVLGGDEEFVEKPSPNPALKTSGTNPEIWIADFSGGGPRKVGEGYGPAISPKGDVVAFIQKGQIWQVSLNNVNAPAEQLLRTRGISASPTWAPDGSALAFVSQREDHSFIGVYVVATKSLSYVDPGTDYDISPAWSPDSRRIAFVRVPYVNDELDFVPRRAGEPWSLRVAQVDTGKGREVWRASDGQGSVFHEWSAKQQVFWGAGDALVFPWERDGWLHIYSVPVSGGPTVLLTPGDFEVEHVTISPNQETVVYSSNQARKALEVDLRHVWSVALKGGTPPQALTGGDGIETQPVVGSDNRTVAVLRSDAHLPSRPAVVASGELHDLPAEWVSTSFPSEKFVVPQQVMITATDGLQIHGQLFLPRDANDGQRHPAVVFLHGGPYRQMLMGWHYLETNSNYYAVNQYLVNSGYIILSINYRSGTGYGLNFRTAPNYGASGASEFNDVLGAGLYLRSRPDVDPLRIGAWGGSYGGYLTALALARASSLFAAGCDNHGVLDWNTELKNWSSYDPVARPDTARLASESSPIASISTWRSPVLLIHGDDDRNVQFVQTVQLAALLRKQGVEFEELIFPDEIHDYLLHRTWLTLGVATADFLDRKLKNKLGPGI